VPLHPDPRFNAFFILTGVTFVGFASGFAPCLFDVDTVDACVAVSNHWLTVLQDAGDHIIDWAIALFHAALRSHGA